MSAIREHWALLTSALCSGIAVPYMALWQAPSLLAIFVKILPCLFLFLHLGKKHLEDKRWRSETSSLETLLSVFGMGSGASQKDQRKTKKESEGRGSQKRALKRRQLREGFAFGLLWSLLGDVLLLWINVDVPFMLGMLAFGVTQVCYIRGLGFWTVNKWRGAGIYSLLLGVTIVVLKDAPLIFRATVPFYSAALTTTLWRAIDRYGDDDGRSSMQKTCSVLGAVAFVISDTCIAFSKFVVAVNPATASAVIHITYYLAQILFTVGAA